MKKHAGPLSRIENRHFLQDRLNQNKIVWNGRDVSKQVRILVVPDASGGFRTEHKSIELLFVKKQNPNRALSQDTSITFSNGMFLYKCTILS